MKLRDKSEVEPRLGTNWHLLSQRHQRTDFVLEHYKPGIILDVACGEGAFSKILAGKHNHVFALDIVPAPNMIDDPRIIFLEMDFMKDFDHINTYDTVLLMEFIEHIESPELAIELAFTALKPSGKLLITTPWVGTWDNEPDHLWRWATTNEYLEQFEMSEEFFRIYQRDTWKDDIFIYDVITKR